MDKMGAKRHMLQELKSMAMKMMAEGLDEHDESPEESSMPKGKVAIMIAKKDKPLDEVADSEMAEAEEGPQMVEESVKELENLHDPKPSDEPADDDEDADAIQAKIDALQARLASRRK